MKITQTASTASSSPIKAASSTRSLLKVDGLTSSPYTCLTAYYTAEGKNDVSWIDTLTNGAITTTAWSYSVLVYVND
jgi:hypothetical protein